MMQFIHSVAVVVGLCLTAAPAFTQGAGSEWDILNQEVTSLYQKGQYDRAVVIARKALKVAEKNTALHSRKPGMHP